MYSISPYNLVTTKIITGFKIDRVEISLFKSASFMVILHDSNNSPVDVKHITMANDDYVKWSSDDAYVVSFVKNALGFSYEEILPAPAVEPAVVEPEPAVVDHVVVEPDAVEPAVVEPGVVEPAVVEPGVVESPVVEPGVDVPDAVEPAVDESPVVVEPAVDESHVVDPAVVDL